MYIARICSGVLYRGSTLQPARGSGHGYLSGFEINQWRPLLIERPSQHAGYHMYLAK